MSDQSASVSGSVTVGHTLAFVWQFLPAAPAEVLEVGAGDGELALALSSLNYSVTAIDAAPACVAEMRARGVHAVLASWPEYVGPEVSAVVFSRSLHHLPLSPAVARAKSLLAPEGAVIVEDFAFSEMPDSALTWLRSLLARLLARDVWTMPADGFLARVAGASGSIASLVGARHDIADASAMRRVLADHGTLIHESATAYFYRYLMPGLPPTPAGNALLREILDDETSAIEKETLWPLGRRWVIKP